MPVRNKPKVTSAKWSVEKRETVRQRRRAVRRRKQEKRVSDLASLKDARSKGLLDRILS